MNNRNLKHVEKTILSGIIRFLFLILVFSGIISNKSYSQCTVKGVSGSGFLYAGECAPVTTVIYYEFTFSGTTPPPNATYRVLYFWGDGTTQNALGTVQTRVVGGITVYYLRTELSHTYPAAGNCEYLAYMVLVDNGFQCSDSYQAQVVSNWHQDDVAAAHGHIAMNPIQEDVCEGLPLIDFSFTDVSNFACNKQDFPIGQKPNHNPRHQQFIYGTNPIPGRGIPNLFIKVGTAQTVVYLTDNDGNPITGPWNVDPVTGAIVTPYNTQSGCFEGPVVEIPLDPVTGVYSLHNTYPISFNGVGTVYQDQFEVTLRNWNVCNPWNGSQTAPNDGDANLATSLIFIVDGPNANAGPDASVCAGDPYVMNGSVQDAISSNWTTLGNGSFTNSTSPGSAVYNAGPADLAAGYVDLVLHAYGTGMCPEHTDTMRLSFDPLPDVPTISISAGTNGFCDDDSRSITLSSSVSPNGSYLWRRNGVSTGITTRTITLNDYTQSGNYTVTVYGTTPNQCPRISAPFTVTIYQPATTNNPVDQTVCQGSNVSFSVTPGGPARTIRWQRSADNGVTWTDITGGSAPNDGCTYSGYTSTTLSISGAAFAMNNYQYRARLTTTSGGCITTSLGATLTVNPTASITNQPANVSICEFNNTSFSVTASVPASYTITGYQWQRRRTTGSYQNITSSMDGGIYSNFNTATLDLTAVPRSVSNYRYQVIIYTTGGCTIISNYATLTVNPLADITSQPPNRSVCAGSGTTFTVSNDGNPAVTSHQWQVSTNGGVTWTNLSNNAIYSGVTSATLSLTNIPLSYNSYRYRCRLSTAGPCDIYSNAGLLTVHSLPLNRTVNADDYWLCYNTGTNINLVASENSIIYQLRRGTVNVGSPQTGNGTNLVFPTGNLTSTTTYNVYAAKTTTIGASTLTCYLQMSNTPTINVNPNITITDLNHNDICLDGTIDLPAAVASGGTGNFTYAWTGTGGYTNNTQNPDPFSPSSTGPHSYTVVATDNGFRTASSDNTVCTVADNIAFTVNPLPAINMSLSDPSICIGQTATITLANSVSGTRYQLRLDSDNSNVGSPVNGNGGDIVFNVNPLVTTTYNVLATIVATGCEGQVTDKSTVTVNPLPDPVISGPVNVCQHLTNTVSYSVTNVANHTYLWNVTNGTISGSNTGHTVNVIWHTPGTGTLTVTETITATGCSKTTPAYTVTVNPGPPTDAPDFSSGDANICRNGTLNLDVSDVATAIEYIWDFSWVPGTNNATTTTSEISIDLTGLAPGTYTVTVAGSNGCGTGPWMTPAHSFNINDIPDLAPLDNTVCSDAPSAITFSISNAGPTITGLTYDIKSINMNGLVPSAGSPATGTGLAAAIISDDAYTNKTSGNVNVIYTVVPVSSEGCTGAQENVTLTVMPEPVLANLSTPKCSDEALGFNLSVAAGSSAAASYNITGINSNGLTASAGSPATGNNLPANVIADDAWTNTTNSPVNVVYSIVPVGTNGCTGDTYTMTITVNPEPVLANLNTIKCSDQPLGFSLATATGSVPAANYNITSINANGLTASAGSPAPGTGFAANVIADDAWTNTTNAPVDVVYTVVPVSAAGCQGDPRTITITVNPEPSLANLSNEVCSDSPSGITLAVAGTSVPAATYNITAINTGGLVSSAGSPAVGNGLLADVIADDAWTNKTSANVNVVYTVVPVSVLGCSGNPVDVTLTVRPEPVLANLDRSICSDEPFGFNLSLASGSSPAASYNITAINSNGLTASAGSPAPGTGFAANVIADDAWTNTTGSPVNVVYSIVPVGVNGCPGDTYTMTITVNPEPVLASLVQPVCSDQPLGFSLATATGSVAAATYNIISINSNGLTASAGSPAPGTGFAANVIADDAWTNTTADPVDVVYTVVPVSASGCEGNAGTITITVNPEPVLADLNTTICSDAPLNFNLATAAGSVAAATYNITAINSNGLTASAGAPAVGNGLSANVIADDAWRNTTPHAVNVVYTIVPVSSSGCPGNPVNMTIRVNPEPVLATTGKEVCSREPLNVNLAVNPGGVAAASYNIISINANGLVPSAGSPAAGNGLPANEIADDAWINTTSAIVNVVYRVAPLSADNCEGNPVDITFAVKPEPVISPNQTVNVCSGNPLDYSITLDNFTNPGAGVTFTWGAPVLNPADPAFTGGNPRNTASSANITDTFVNTLGIIGTATYTVTPYYNGCAGQPVDIVMMVGSEPVLDPGLDDFACSNDAIGLVLREAAGSVAPSHYNIISVNMETGLSAASTNAIVPNDNAPATYLSGDIFENKTGVDKTVTYRVQPVLAPDCFGDPVDVVMTIRPQPVIVPGQTSIVCSGEPIDMEILLIPANTPAGVRFNWNAPAISDGSVQGSAGSGVEADPAGTVHINDVIRNYSSAAITATYRVTPVSAEGCRGEEVAVIITINPEPLPKPISGRADLCAGELAPVVYSVSPVSGSSFHWTVDPAVGTKTFDFNTNAIMITAATVAGTGNISVYETNSLGCSGAPFTLPVRVWDSPDPENITGEQTVCAYSTHTYSVTHRPGSVYSWTLPGGAALVGNPSGNSIQVVFGNVGGTILVRETNIAGCITDHDPLAVTVNPQPTANITNGGTMCDGGTRALTVSFIGTAPFSFTYAINGTPQAPISTSDNPYILNATLAGTYSVVNVTDNTGCTGPGSGTATITYFPKPTGIISGTAELCRGSQATITMTFTGVPPYTFTYTDGTTPVTVTNHPNSVYTANVSPSVSSTYTLVSLNDGNNCDGVLSGQATINVNQPPSLSLTGTDLICHNVPTGAVDLTITGGTSPFGISWTGPNGFTSTAEDISGLNEGYYAVTVSDSKGCHATANITIMQPRPLYAAVDRTNVTCYGADDGTITISGSDGGSGFYEYSIDGGIAWSNDVTYTGLAPGTYVVMIRDLVNPTCMLTLNPGLQITSPPILSGTVGKTDITCHGSHDGTITISNPAGGYGTYQYSHNGGTDWQDSPVFTNLSAATYSMVIRDRANPLCRMDLGPVVINEPDALAATVNSTDATCFGANNGTITISGATGGYGVYEYSINGGASWQASNTFPNLSPGTYNVRMRDRANPACTIIINPSLVITEPAILSATVARTNVTCNGANDGTITITNPAGGYGTYEYTVDGGLVWQSPGTFTGLAPGFYNVKIRDAANVTCEITLRPALQITEPAVLSASVASVNITCNGADDARITITNPLGGSGTYEYTVDGGSVWQSSGTFVNLAPDTYNVRIRDAANPSCENILNNALVITEPLPLSATVTPAMITCFGAGNGIIAISNPAGGYGTYEYTINGGIAWSASGNFTGLLPGTYDVRMRDAVHKTCEIILDPALAITQPPVLAADVARTNVTCFGGSDGTITVSNPTGGYGTYQYTVNGGGAWQDSGNFIGLAPGMYNVQIRDAANPGCVIVLNSALQITQPAILNGIISTVMVTCNGAGDGIISITNPTGGSGSYEFSSDGGQNWQTTATFTGLAPGSYDVRIRDAANTDCEIILNPSVLITEPAVLSAVVAKTDITCHNANNGRIVISSPSGGYGTYDYSVDGGTNWQQNGTFSNLLPGFFNVMMRDRVRPACTMDLGLVEITEPDELSASVSATMVSCNGANDGRIEITGATGGYGVYQYSVTGGSAWQSSGTFNYLTPGTYEVRIRDAANITCYRILDPALIITQPPRLTATVTGTNVTCHGANDATITISSPAGGYGTYEYSINGGLDWHSDGSFNSLAPGYYNVQIRDAANPSCVVVLNGSFRVTEPAALGAGVARTHVTCFGADNGTITISSAYGGSGTYEYTIDGTTWASSGSFSGLAPGIYNVQVRDAANPACVEVIDPALAINEPDELSATITSTDITCHGANDGTISVTNPAGGYGTYHYSINGGITWQGFGNYTSLAPDTYEVRIRDAANPSCEIILNNAVTIAEPDILSATISSTNVSCFGGGDGSITINNATGGSGTYEYSINGGGSWNAAGIFTNLIAGAYNILIRDASHPSCIIVLNNAYLVTQPALLSATVSKTEVSCHGFNDGTISITSPAGGYGTYEYSIDGGLSWHASGFFNNLIPGTYDVRMRDEAHHGCAVILYPNLLITEPIRLSLSTTGDVVLNCHGDNNGMGTFYASGGTMPYTFIVDNQAGATVAGPGFNSQTFFNASAGVVNVTVVDANGCSDNASIQITQPDELLPGSIGDDQTVCSGDIPAAIRELTPATGGPGARVFQWQSSTSATGPFVNIAGANGNDYTPTTGATYTQYYRRMVTSGTCMPVYSAVVGVFVNPRPVAFLTGGGTICPGENAVIRITMPAGTGPFTVEIDGLGTINNYNSGDDITVSPAATTTYSLVSVIDANNCEVVAPSPNLSGTATVTVSDLPLITLFTPPDPVCEFSLASFRVTATGTNLTYQWYVDDGNSISPVSDGGTYFGALTPTLQIFNAVRSMDGNIYHVAVTGCGTTVTSDDAVLTVNTAPEISLHPRDSTVCLGQNAIMEADASGTGITWQWWVNRGSGFVLLYNDSHFSGSQTRELTITDAQSSFNGWIFRAVASGACGVPVYTNFAVLRVINPPEVTRHPAPVAVCEDSPASFLGNGRGYTTLQWQVNTGGGWTDLSDGADYIGTSTQQLLILNASSSMNGNLYRLALVTSCAVVPTDPARLTVNANPVVDFSGISPMNACGSVPVTLNGNPTDGSGSYTQHRWTGDVGPLNNYFVQSPEFRASISGTYDLNYRVTDSNGCTASDDLRIIVNSPSAQFTYDVPSGCSPLTVRFNKDMSGIDEWWWDFDDGTPIESTEASPEHVFVNNVPGSVRYYNVTLRVRSGTCFAEYRSTITAYSSIDASFTPDNSVICSGNSITFTALPGASNYFWDYGDGSSGYGTHSARHSYTNTGTTPEVHTVTLTTYTLNNCTDVQTYDITVMPVPVPQFTADPWTQVFKTTGNPVIFTNTTNAGTWNWLWRFGDGTTSTEMNPHHNYTQIGDYNVTLIAGNASCTDSVKHSVSVLPPAPVADFDSIPSGCAPLFVNISNTSLNTDLPGTTYHWDFGDGSTSTAKNPTYTYFTPGSYTVRLYVVGPGGTSDYSQAVHAHPSPKAYFEITPPQVYANDKNVRCFNLSQGGSTYLWDFGDGETSTEAEPVHKYMKEGVYDISLTVTSANGCTDQYILSPAVTVLPVGELRYPTVFIPNKTGPIERSDLPTGGLETDQFFYPPIRQLVLDYKLQIFNRWGVLIFETHDINTPWNGYYKGELCPQGVYVWLVEGKFADGKPYKKAGNITLLH